VPYHRVPDLTPPAEADLDTPEMAEASACVDRGEADLGMLERLARIGMELAEAQGDYVRWRLAAATGADAPLKPGEDPTAAFDKLAQTVRRTLALKSRLAHDLDKNRAGLVAERARRRAQRVAEHAASVTDAIDDALTDAFTVMYGDGEAETDEGDALCREMLIDKEDLLRDLAEFEDYLDRPVGETIARLCVALGLDPDTCVRDGGGWRVRRPPTAYRLFRETRAAPSGARLGAALGGCPP
jgi:hypothetical protein